MHFKATLLVYVGLRVKQISYEEYIYVTGPAKINHVSTKITAFFHLCSIITYELFIITK